MPMKGFVLMLSIFCICLSACKKKAQSGTINFSNEYFAFGEYYGMCSGNCARFLLLQDNKLYADKMDQLSEPWLFSDVQLSDEKKDEIKLLLEKLPDYLKTTTVSTFGCPDCHDQGGIYIQFKKEGTELKNIIIDTDIKAQPIEIQAYVKELSAALDFLRQ